MLDSELLQELDDASHKSSGTARLPDDAAAAYVQRIAETCVGDPCTTYWWDSLKVPATRVPYGEAAGLAIIEDWLGDRADVRLVVTDDEGPPWPVYAGTARQLVAILRECRFCEFMMGAKDASWVVFDTHMNELVCVGLDV